jgi:hypothetical protein
MRTITKTLLIMITLLILVQTVAALASPRYQVTLVNQDPDPVEPGEIVEVRFKVENQGSQSTENVIFEVLPEYPLSIYGSTTIRNLGRMSGDMTGLESQIVDFKFRVDDNAVESEVELEVQMKTREGITRIFRDNEFLIDINTNDPILAVEGVQTSDRITPGEVASINLTLVNRADTLIQDIEVMLSLNNTPFAPYQSTAEQRVFQIRKGEKNTISFTVITTPTTDAGVYKIPFVVTYQDERGEIQQREDLISLVVGAEPQLQAYVKDSSISQAETTGIVTIELANSGLTDIKLLSLELAESDDYDILSTSNVRYIGDIDTDDIETEEFELYAATAGSLTLPVTLNYRDANNKEYVETLNLPLKVFSSSERSQYGLQSTPWGLILLVILFASGLGYYLYRKHRGKK